MKSEMIKCDCCGKMTEDFHGEVGWISMEVSEISISGCRKKDGCANTFRYITSGDDLHFCGHKCLLKFLYLKKGYFNNPNLTLEQKLATYDVRTASRLNAILRAIKLEKAGIK